MKERYSTTLHKRLFHIFKWPESNNECTRTRTISILYYVPQYVLDKLSFGVVSIVSNCFERIWSYGKVIFIIDQVLRLHSVNIVYTRRRRWFIIIWWPKNVWHFNDFLYVDIDDECRNRYKNSNYWTDFYQNMYSPIW